MQHVAFLLLGLGNGAVFGALALAVVLTYRSSGVINFATGAIALYTAYTYAFLRQGDLLLVIPGLPTRVNVGGPVAMIPALLISVVIAAVLGLLLYLIVFRPLRSSPFVARAVAALGVSLIITGLVANKAGTALVTVAPIFPTDIWQSGSLQISADRVYFALTILGVAVLLAIAFRFTRFGLATKASAESERGAFVSGISPDRIAAYNWMLSSAVAGLAGILIAPIVPLAPVSYTLFIVPALAAAIVARFQFVIIAVVAGLVIGALQSEAQFLASTHTWLPTAGLPELIPLVLILVVLLVRAKPLPGRGTIILQNLGRAPRPHRVASSAVIITVIGVIGLVVLGDRLRNGLIISIIMAIIALSTVVVTGYAGQVSLAQLTIAGVAGFLVGPLTNDLHIPFPIAPLLAALCAAVLGVIIGLPALRIRGLIVAVVTLAMAFAVEALWFRNSDIVGVSGVVAPKPSIFGWDLSIGGGGAYPRVTFGVMCLLVLVAVAVGIAYLRRSRLGSQMLAVRANERSAAAAGVSVVRVKIIAFGIGAFVAGLGGSLLAYQQQTVTFDSFSALASVGLFATVYLAGATSIAGGLLAGVIATGGLLAVVSDEAGLAGEWFSVISSVLLVLALIFYPEGLVGPAHSVLARQRMRRHHPDDGPDADRDAAVGTSDTHEKAPLTTDDEIELVLDELATAGVGVDAAPDASGLSLHAVSVHYGGVRAVNEVTIDIAAGSLVGLIGPNGAGKTTVMDAICGFADYTGDVVLNGGALSGLAPHRRIRAGLGRTFQAIELYEDLSVYENVKVGCTASEGRERTTTDAAPGDGERIAAVLALLDLTSLRDRPASELSQGHRQLVSIARALAGSPTLLLLDEPAGGLDSTESRWLGERLRRICDTGVSVLLVDHDVDLVLSVCDVIHVLNFGEVIASGPPEQIRHDRAVTEAYLGGEAKVNG